jgi:hypothetical protein
MSGDEQELMSNVARDCLIATQGDFDRAAVLVRNRVVGEEAQERTIQIMQAVWWAMTEPDTPRQ